MKSTIVSMIIVLCVLAIIPMFLIGDNSVLESFGLGGSGNTPKTPKGLTNVTTDVKVQVYKWRDEHGVMQFTNTPPPQTQQAEMVELTPNTNIVKAFEIPQQELVEKRSGPRVVTTGNPYTPGGMKQMLDTTSELSDQMNQKQLDQQKLIDSIFGNKK